MAKGFVRSGDPAIQTIDNAADGNYSVDGISKFITTGADDKPCFAPNKRGELSVSFEFRMPNGGIAPAGSATVYEFWMLVALLGGDITSISPKQRATSEALLRAQESVNSNSRAIMVQSTAGWANGLYKQLKPPEGKYKVKLAKVQRPDFTEGLEFQEVLNSFTKAPQQQLVFLFEIVGSASGKSTLYDGYKMWQYMGNPFVAEATTLDGVKHTAKDDGCPIFGRTEKGGETAEAYNWNVFIQYCAPNMFEHDWSQEELVAPHVPIIEEALEAQLPFTVVWRKKEKSKNGNFGFTWKDVRLENELPEAEVEEEEVIKELNTLEDLTNYITAKWEDVQVFDTSVDGKGIFTDAGRAWAKEFLGNAWTQAGFSLENRKPLYDLTAEEITKLLQSFKTIYGEINQVSGW